MDAYTATLFFRHNRPLRALMIEGQCWFCLHDLARLLAIPYPERLVRRLDADQHREQRVDWRDEPWIRLRDMPREQAPGRGRWWALWR